MARARAGDTAAFRALVDAYRDRAYGLALRIVRAPEDAEEIAQDAFVRAWRALPQFRGDARFSTWLYRIVTRRAFDANAVIRRRQAREVALEGIDTMGDGVGGGMNGGSRGGSPAIVSDGSSAGTSDALGASRRIEKMIAALPEAYRAVVTLHYFEDRSVEEIARVLDAPEGTVKTHLFRARARLRDLWLAARESRVVP